MHPTNHTGTRITLCLQERLYLGNLDAKRDWGHTRDHVRMQWLMLQQDHPEDYVIATGQQHAVRDFVQQAAREIGIEIRWEGSRAEEKGSRLPLPTRTRRGAGPEKNAASSRSTRATSAPPRSRLCSAMPARPAISSAGSPRSASRS